MALSVALEGCLSDWCDGLHDEAPLGLRVLCWLRKIRDARFGLDGRIAVVAPYGLDASSSDGVAHAGNRTHSPQPGVASFQIADR
jgi:hypothetical protein